MNLATGKSQWELPNAPVPSSGTASSEPPPSYDQAGPPDPATAAAAGDKKRPLGSNNPYNSTGPSQDKASSTIDSDAQLAARLQAEEDARARNSGGSRDPGIPGSATDYYSGSSQPQPTSSYTSGSSSLNSMPEQKSRSKGGFLSKLMGKSSSNSRPRPQYASYPQQPPPNAGYYDPNYGRYQQQPAPGYGYPPAGYGGYPQQAGGYYQQQPQRKHGMGTAGAAALGVGGGLLGGLLLADAVEDLDDHHDYDNGPGDSGWDDGGGGFDGGGDFDGGDF